jgi:hypothetical protein
MTGEQFERDLIDLGFTKVLDGDNKKFVKDGSTLLGRPCRHCEVTTMSDGMNIAYTTHGFSKYNRGLTWRAMAEKKTAIQVFGEMFKYFNL